MMEKNIFLSPLDMFPLWYIMLVWTLAYSLLFIVVSGIYHLSTTSRFQTISLEAFLGRIHNVFTSQWDSEDVVSLKKAWAEIILPCFPHRKFYHRLWELPFLALLSFYTLIRTRFHLVQVCIIYRALLFLVLFDESRILLVYSGPALILTLLVSLPVFKRHFAKVYSPNLLKMVGWNTITKVAMAQAKTGAKFAVTALGVWGLGEVAFPYIGGIRAVRYARSVHEANEVTLGVNKVLEANGQTPGPFQRLNGDKYIALKETNLLREGFNAFKELIPYIEKGKLPPKK